VIRHPKTSSVWKLGLPLAMASILVLALASGAQASLGVNDYFPGEDGASEAGGRLSAAPANVAVNDASGDVYVADSGNNRVQQFTGDGNFIRAFGADVIAGGKPNASNEVQAVRVNAAAGQFTLTFGPDSTADLPFDAGAAEVQSALNGLGAIAGVGGSVVVSGGPGNSGGATPYLVTFSGGTLAGTDVAQMSVSSGTTPLTGGSPTGASVATTNPGATGFEICDVTAPAPNAPGDCKKGGAVAIGGGLSGPRGVAINQSTGDVYVTNQGFRRVDQFTANGTWVRAWGRDVVSVGPHGSGTGAEICNALDLCQTGIAGSLGGEFGGTTGNTGFNGHPAIVPAGPENAANVIIADPGNLRVQEFTATGTFVRAFGFDVEAPAAGPEFEVCVAAANCKAGVPGSGVGQFGTRNPQRVAADSTGTIFAVEPPNNAGAANWRVQRFSPQPGPSVLQPSIFAAGSLSGTRNENSPTAIAVDPDDDHVFVLKGVVAGEGSPPAEGNESRVLELDSSGSVVDIHMANAGLNPGSGATPLIGVDIGAGGQPLYLSSTTIAPRVYQLDEVPPPQVTVSPASDITSESATLHATIGPSPTAAGFSTFYRFEYSKNGLDWVLSSAFIDLGNGSGGGASPNCPTPPAASCEVEQTIGNLDPNEEYLVRVTARTEFNGASTTVDGPDVKTPRSRPVLSTGGASWSNAPRGDAPRPTLLVKGTVNARNEETNYFFEYVEEDAYNAAISAGGNGFENATRTETAQAGQGLAVVAVQRVLFDVDPTKSYRYRLVATNAMGAEVAATRTIAAPVSGDRFYELISVGDSWGIGINARVGSIAESGNRALFTAQAFGQPESVPGPSTPYISRRTDFGWSVSPMVPDPDRPQGSFKAEEFMASADLEETLWPEATFGQRLRGEVDWALVHLDGTRTAVPPAITPLAHSGEDTLGQFYPIGGGASDLSSFVFRFLGPSSSSVKLFPDEPLLGLAYRSNLYENAGGEMRLVNRATDPSPGVPGAIIGGSCGAGLGANLEPAVVALALRAVSDDGSAIYFSALDTEEAASGICDESAGKRLFKRVDGESTVRISAAQCSPVPACPGGPNGDDNFRGASADGDVVFFTTPRRLVNSDGNDTNDLYIYDATPFAGEPELAQASFSSPPGSEAMVGGVLDVAHDGSRAYFVADGVLTTTPNGQGDTPVVGQPNLYVYERSADHPQGRVAFIDTLSPADSAAWLGGRSFALPNQGSEASGRFLLFLSTATLVDEDEDESKDLYRYDDQTGGLVCLSCVGNGAFDVNIRQMARERSTADEVQQASVASADVKEVAFTTAEPLLGADGNVATDAYVWSEGTGVELVSGGTEALGVLDQGEATGVSPDGRSVYFVTRAALVAADGNNQVDLYTARVGGGFPAESEASVCHDDEACRGAQPGEPPPPPPPPSILVKPGNPSSVKPCRKNQVRRNGRCVSRPQACKEGQVKKRGKCVRKSKPQKGNAKGKRTSNDRGGNR